MSDELIEAMLDAAGVRWALAEVALDDINEAASLRNQARLSEPLDPDTVERYTLDMRSGAVFPPVLARRVSARSKLVLLGGNHRYAAAKAAGRLSLPAYVVEVTDEALATRLMFEDNRRHGLAPNREERLQQALHLSETGWTVRDAAAAVGVPETTLATYRTIARASRRAAALGVGPMFDALGWEKRARLAQLNDPVLVEATRLVASAGLTRAATVALSRRLTSAGSDEAALRIVGDAIEEHRSAIQARAGGRGGRRRGPAPAASRAAGSLAVLLELEPADIAASVASEFARSTLRKRLRDLGPWAVEVMKALS